MPIRTIILSFLARRKRHVQAAAQATARTTVKTPLPLPRMVGFLLFFFLPVLILGTLSVFHPMPTGANEPSVVYYVATDGDDQQAGTVEHPWASLNHAADVLQAGDTVYVKEGLYMLSEQIRPQQSGMRDRLITYAAAPGEHVILDAQQIAVPAPSGEPPFAHDQGAFQLEDVAHIRVRDLELINSHNAGFTVRHSSHIQLYNNTTNNTFSSGIGLWNGDHHEIMGNTVINANLPRLTDYERDNTKQTPHEAITLGGVEYFEVAYNHVLNSAKEGIDIKEVSRHGTVHHNHVHHVDRQGLYVDSWFGVLEDVELYDNVVHHCKGGGFMVSAEGGELASNIRFHHNVIHDNWGTGIFLSRWGDDRPRKHLEIYNNTVYHNGFGPPNPGEDFHWITGGLYLFTTQLEDVGIHHNIFAHNTGFQIGYSDRYLQTNPSVPVEDIEENAIDATSVELDGANLPNAEAVIPAILQQKGIRIHDNLIQGVNDTQTPIYAGWAPDDFAYIYGIYGTTEHDSPDALGDGNPTAPLFVDAYQDNFQLNPNLPHQYADRGALPQQSTRLDSRLDSRVNPVPLNSDFCHINVCPSNPSTLASPIQWQRDFPPRLEFGHQE